MYIIRIAYFNNKKKNANYRLDKIKNNETKTNDVETIFYIKQW